MLQRHGYGQKNNLGFKTRQQPTCHCWGSRTYVISGAKCSPQLWGA